MTFEILGTDATTPGIQLDLPPAGHAMLSVERDFYFIGQDNVHLARTFLRSAVKEEFTKHERQWKRDTRFTSSLADKFLHPSYARIIGMGWPAVSLILKSLERQTDDWFYALRAITGADPVNAKDVGHISKMAQAWLRWGRERGLI